jgi:glycosyltransferase involved in cell wall biosynthesis
MMNKSSTPEPTVSIGVPAYNSERWIERTIQSLLSQTFTDFELIISDNCSDDNTYAICKALAQKDERIMLYTNKNNIGAAKNYNKTFKLARGKYFKWASSNDLCGATFLEKCVKVLDANPEVSLAIPKTQIIDSNDKIIKVCEENFHLSQPSAFERFEAFLDRVRLNNPEQGLIRASVLRKTHLQAVYPNSDTILIAEIAARGKVYQIQDVLLSRRQSQSSATKLMSESEVANFYSPNKSHIPNVTLRTFLALIGISTRISVPFMERLKFYCYAVRYLRWGRKNIAEELSAYFKRIIKTNV